MSIRLDRLDDAIFEAERFLKRAKELKKSFRGKDENRIMSCPENAAVKRASMDLTRSLAKLRNPGWE